jgi:predicted nucleic acid-binding protein
MIVLDTNVLSALMHTFPDQKVVAWLDDQPRTSIWTTSITVLEIRFGLETMATGKRRTALTRSFASLLDAIEARILAFDVAAAEQTGLLMASRKRKGVAVELRDDMIAGIVLSQHATLATRNIPHFADGGISLVNPWTA